MAAEYLLYKRVHGDLVRVLETGMAVCYWRPFSGNQIGRLDDRWFPSDVRERYVHDRLKVLRDKVFAHSDETVARGVEDAGNLFGPDYADRYVEAWRPLNENFTRAVLELATGQDARFKDAAHALDEDLRTPVNE